MNFIQGSVWKEKQEKHDSQCVLPIFLFFDDYEVGNSLGSHSGVHKLGAVCISIPCLPLHIQSTLKTIFLALLFHSTDRQKFGEQGIDIESNAKLVNIKFELGLILGDNLGIHSIIDFVESFSANYPCRMCKVHKEIMRKQSYVDETLIRVVDDYNFDLIENNVSSSEVLNNRIISFDYGPDKGSKPCVLNIDHIRKNTIGLSASEMMLVRYFGSLIGDFVPQNEPVWYLYISLRKILDILTFTSFQKECSKLLQKLVAEHNELYLILSKNNLKPKYHYLLHYPTMMLKFGTLINLLWSMRFEAKHRISKIAANISSRNIEFSPPQSVVDIDSIIKKIKVFTKIEVFDSLWKYSWINIKGT
ncbi:uncharacterized protein LOC132926082 [Rhopalosiphum padi]|uniref:uncharacterized protein LOC132926082 n=1 Tax=Rhopalosiphum padi TaxID=40932 RepID=UPI00298E6EA8|nr:uncharacterized protein LOC132926082 [Rhopalosiphum padi]